MLVDTLISQHKLAVDVLLKQIRNFYYFSYQINCKEARIFQGQETHSLFLFQVASTD